MGSKNPWGDWAQIFFGGKRPRRITPFKFGDGRFRGFGLAEGQILAFPIYFEGRPYNTHTIVWNVIGGRTLRFPDRQLQISDRSDICVYNFSFAF